MHDLRIAVALSQIEMRSRTDLSRQPGLFFMLFVMSSAAALAQSFTISASPNALMIHLGGQNISRIGERG
jgi:hypothetical protein